MTGPQTEPVSLQYITDTLQNHEPFYFWVNDGNLGDYIIAEATLQLFCRAKLQWQPYDPNNPPQEKKYVLVYGGGGRFVSYWQGIERIQKHLTKPEVKHCIILPHSLHDVDSFVKALDERHIVFCRERKTLTYCQSINNQSKFILAHDIGLSLDLDKLTPLHALDNLVITNECTETAAQFKLLTSKSAKKIRKKAQKAIVIAPGNKKKIAFFLRNDAEKNQRPYFLLGLSTCPVYGAVPVPEHQLAALY